ncbi:MAG TPA: rhodanese-like domain-containing protein [Gammaproteobacteria bacterium]|nr:rhodanese-like domain-containing protein [Gammaproteobacteria bacterium]
MPGTIEELSPRSFCQLWPESTRAQVQLLDVREPAELAIATLPNATHIPMLQVPLRLDELDPQRPIVVLCHSGGRSRQVAAFLLANGFERVYNLAGGIDAWSTDIDPSVPRY